MCAELRGADFQAANQADVSLRIVLNQIQHPLVVGDPLAGFDNHRGRDLVFVRHLVKVSRQNRPIKHRVRWWRPGQPFRPRGVVKMDMGVNDGDGARRAHAPTPTNQSCNRKANPVIFHTIFKPHASSRSWDCRLQQISLSSSPCVAWWPDDNGKGNSFCGISNTVLDEGCPLRLLRSG